MPHVKTAQETVNIAGALSDPVFNLSKTSQSYFRAIYEEIGSIVTVRAADFSFIENNSISASAAIYRIVGGHYTITLKADSILIELPNISESDATILNRILLTLYDRVLPRLDGGISLRTISVYTSQHLELIDKSTPYFRIDELNTEDYGELRVLNGVQSIVSQGTESWILRVKAEDSALFPGGGGIFVYYEISLNDLTNFASGEVLIKKIKDIYLIGKIRILNLECEG